MLLSLLFLSGYTPPSLYRASMFILTRTNPLFEFPFARGVGAQLVHSDLDMMLENKFQRTLRLYSMRRARSNQSHNFMIIASESS